MLLGKPVIAYVIEAALTSNCFDEVMVSTDDAEIAKMAELYGADVPFLRSEENARDQSGTLDVLKEVLSNYKAQEKVFDLACCLYPTSALITAETLIAAKLKMITHAFDGLMAVLEYSHPIQRALRIDGEEKATFFWPENRMKRTQDLEKSYHDAGQFYWFKPNVLFAKNDIITNNTGAEIISPMHAQDVDNPSDWEMLTFKMKYLKSIENED
tara:strand:- start:14212 stop:14850 length:639 start_codon:yes stop_codon:yes gene_type:complete